MDFASNASAARSVVLHAEHEWKQAVAEALQPLRGGQRFDAVVGVAGGWAGGDAAEPSVLATAEKMWSMNVQPSFAGASVRAPVPWPL